jgi:hypothetical protein
LSDELTCHFIASRKEEKEASLCLLLDLIFNKLNQQVVIFTSTRHYVQMIA